MVTFDDATTTATITASYCQLSKADDSDIYEVVSNWSALSGIPYTDDEGNSRTYYALPYANLYEATTSVTVYKDWQDSDNQDGFRPEFIEVQLTANGDVSDTQALYDSNDWTYTWDDLPVLDDEEEEITYNVEEITELPAGYETSVGELTDNGDGTWSVTITNSYETQKTDVTVIKEWNDDENNDGIRPASISVQLTADGAAYGEPVELTPDDWTYTWEELDVYADGQKITYSVDEIDEIPNYVTSEPVLSGDAENGYVITITNSHEDLQTSVTVTKVWNDDNDHDGKRAESIYVQLTADGAAYGEPVELTPDDWTYTWEELDVYADGQQIAYSVEEPTVPDGYTSSVGALTDNGDGTFSIEITNSHEDEKTSVTVTKVWNDNDNNDGMRGSYGVTLTGTVTSSDDPVYSDTQIIDQDQLTYTWEDLDVYADGEEISYSVDETTVPDGYEQAVGDLEGNAADGYTVTITNSHEDETTSVTVTKVWNDNDNNDGMRGSYGVTLTGTVTSSDDPVYSDTQILDQDQLSYTWSDLSVYINGEEISYSVDETTVPDGYVQAVGDLEGNAEDGYTITITNSHADETTEVTVTKVWDDDQNHDGMRPGSVSVQLTADGAAYGEPVELTPDDWTYTWDELDVYADGQEIAYSVEEAAVAGYTTSIGELTDNGNGTFSIEITNSHEDETTSVTVTKVWNDNDNNDGMRGSYGVTLTGTVTSSDDPVYSDTQTLDQDQLTYTWEDLDVYADGEEISYSVDETTVPDGYAQAVGDLEGNAEDGYTVTITNSHEDLQTSVTVTKVWDDNENQDGVRPESITVQLLADGTVINEQALTANDGWTYTWDELDVYADGVEITYEVIEPTTPDDYTQSDTGLTDNGDGTYSIVVTNSHETDKTDVTVLKVWNDENDQDGIRPTEITINLMADGDVIYTQTLDAGDGWTYTWSDLPVNAAGSEISYSIEETTELPEGYEVAYDGNGTYSITVTNSYTPEKIDIPVTKTWDDNDNQDNVRPESITFHLMANGTEIQSVTITPDDKNDADSWNYIFEGLDKYEGGVEIVYTVTEDVVTEYTTDINGFEIINTHAPEEVSLNVQKIWNDDNDQDGRRPDEIEVVLLADGDETGDTLTLNEGNDWSGSFTGLPKYHDQGEEITYSIAEVTVEGYASQIVEQEGTSSIYIYNEHTSAKIDISGEKVWDDADDQDGIRPNEITINLMADGVAATDGDGNAITATATTADNYAWSFEGLPKYHDHGVEIVYSVTEDAIDGYTTEITGNAAGGFTIINTHETEKIDISGSKTWNDVDDVDGIRPESIIIHLLADGTEVDSVEVTPDAEGAWSYSFENLPKYRDGGVEIVYSVTEDEVGGYTTEINGFDVANTHTPTRDLTIQKDVAGNGDTSSYDFEITLTQAGTGFDGELTLSNGETVTFTDGKATVTVAAGESVTILGIEYGLDCSITELTTGADSVVVTDANGNVIASVEGTTTQAVAEIGTIHDSSQVTFTNSYREYFPVDEEIVPDENDRDSWVKDESVNEYNAIEIEMSTYLPVVTAYDVANGEFTLNFHEQLNSQLNLDEADADFSVAIAGYKIDHQYYTVTISPDDGCTFHVDVDLTALYNDGVITDDDLQGTTEIMVFFFADLEGTGLNGTYESTVWYDVVDADEILYTSNVDVVYVYTYEIEVLKVDAATGEALSGATLGVYYDSELTEPVSRNGEPYTVTSGDDGYAMFYGLADGIYYIAETAAPTGYVLSSDVLEVELNENTVDDNYIYSATFGNTAETTDVSGTKTWDDADNQDGTRPDSITIHLLADGEEVDSITVTPDEDGAWTYAFTDLPKYADGVEITYTVTEDAIEGYETTINGFDITNTHTPEGEIPEPEKTVDVGDGTQVNPGDSLTYTISYTNGGEDDATVTITDVLDEGLDFVSATNGGTYDEATRTVTWTLSGVAAGAEGSVSFTVVVNESALSAGEVINSANVQINENPAVATNTVTNPVKVATTVTFDVVKVWDDNNDLYGARPDRIVVVLMQNGKATTLTQLLSDENSWTGTFSDLPEYDENGQKIVYSIAEVTVPNYTSVVTGDQDSGFTVTNTYDFDEITNPEPGTPDGGNPEPGVPQTGQDSLPIAPLAVAGAAIIAAGVVLLVVRRRRAA